MNLNDPNYIRIAQSAGNKYRNLLNEDEYNRCIQLGIFEGLRTYDPERNTKITSHIRNHVTYSFKTYLQENTPRQIDPYRIRKKESYIQNDNYLIIKEILSSLPDEDRRLIIERFYNGLSFNDLGKMFGCNQEAARKKLKSVLSGVYDKQKENFSI